jgi:hypothetical protein
MSNGSMQPSKNTASPQEDATGPTPMAKLEKLEKQLGPPEEAKGLTHLAEATQMQLPLNKCNLLDECMHST